MRWLIFGMLLLASTAGCSEETDAPVPASTELPRSVTQTIGPEGGQIVLDGATVIFPAGAVDKATSITITATEEAPPAGFTALSRVYECGPTGLRFAQKVTMNMVFSADGSPATMFWSSGEDPSFKDVGGALDGNRMAAQVGHFSKGFVGRKNP
jgi:hypothetical protein